MLSPQTKNLKVLLLDPIPSQARDVFLNADYDIDECYDELSEGALAKKLSVSVMTRCSHEYQFTFRFNVLLNPGSWSLLRDFK